MAYGRDEYRNSRGTIYARQVLAGAAIALTMSVPLYMVERDELKKNLEVVQNQIIDVNGDGTYDSVITYKSGKKAIYLQTGEGKTMTLEQYLKQEQDKMAKDITAKLQK